MSIDGLAGRPAEPIARTLGGITVTPAANSRDVQFMKVCIYGDSGKGKTVLAASASVVEEMAPVLFLNTEAGTRSLMEFYPNVDVLPIATYMDYQKVFEDLRKGGHGYKTVVLDSITESHRMSMDKIMGDVVAKDPERDREVPSQREWGKAGEQIRKLVRLFRDLPMHVIFVALEGEAGPENGPKTIGPSLPGKLLKEVPGYVDIVGRLYTAEVQEGQNRVTRRMLLCSASGRTIAKDRTNKIPVPLQEPTMQKLWDAFSSGQN